ncbi:MAG: flagellar basal body-associated protein FliL [Paracoccaceae bacterium]
MIKKLVPVLLLVLGTCGGIAIGVVLPPKSKETNKTAERNELDESSENEFVKMANQFVVPVVEKGKVQAHVVLSLNLEVQPGTRDSVFAREPKLRAELLKVMFNHANMGGFKGAFTTSKYLDPLNNALLEVAQIQLGSSVRDVLIVDIARQDVN